jgi:FixJ family two-component response regulator
MSNPSVNSAVISVVDDDDAVCDAISSLVRSAGYRCVAFGSAEAFLKSGRLGDTECILLDIRMLGMSGLDLQLALCEMNCEIPVIYVTAASDNASRARAFRQGAAAFIVKPFGDEDLLNAIHHALSGPVSTVHWDHRHS